MDVKTFLGLVVVAALGGVGYIVYKFSKEAGKGAASAGKAVGAAVDEGYNEMYRYGLGLLDAETKAKDSVWQGLYDSGLKTLEWEQKAKDIAKKFGLNF